MADSKLCKSCQPKRKPPRLLTNKEIRNRITDGDLRRGLGEAILAERKRALPEKRSRVMKVAWEKLKNEPIRQLKLRIGQQVAKYAKRYNASRYLQDATKEQNRWNYEEAKRVRDELHYRIENGEWVDPNIDIQTLFKTKQHNHKEKHNETMAKWR